MPTPIVIKVQGLELKGEFNDTPAGQALAANLPFSWRASTWGDEYYGSISNPADPPSGGETSQMEVGDLGYYPPNNWFCLFFGPTPASSGDAPVAAVDLHRVGFISADWSQVKALGPGINAQVERA